MDLITALVGFLVNAVVVALLLRPAVRWVALLRVSYDDATEVALVASLLGLLPGILGQTLAAGMGGSLGAIAVVSLLLLPVNGLILALTAGRSLGLRPGTAALVALLVYAMLIATACVVGVVVSVIAVLLK